MEFASPSSVLIKRKERGVSYCEVYYLQTKKTICIIVVLLIVLTVYIYYTTSVFPRYILPNSELDYLNGRTLDVNKPFIFIESSCVSNASRPPGGLKLNGRQACAIYSTAKLHPHRPVYLFHSCPLVEDYYSVSSDGVKALGKLSNMVVVRPNVSDWFSGTPVESRLVDLKSSSHPVEHSSDLLRLALLWKMGATYLDLDVLTIKKLDALGTNWVSCQSENELANGVMDFDKGHVVPLLAMERLKTTFNGKAWASNGPLLIQRIIRKHCIQSEEFKWSDINELKSCDLKVLKPFLMFPFPYNQWQLYFKQPKGDLPNARIYLKLGRAVSIHLYNYLSSKTKSDGPASPYRVMASMYCEEVYKADPLDF